MRFIRNHFRSYDLLLLGLAAALVVLYVRAAGGGFPLDDSWIHQVYGRNLAQAGEWAFVQGQPSAASTSPLYTVLLAVGYALTVPYVLWTHLLGGLALLITGILGARLAEQLAPKPRWAGPLTGGAIILAWHLVWAAASGMETMLFAMFTLLLVAVVWRERDVESGDAGAIAMRGAIFGIVGALTTETRPEGALLVGLIGLLLLLARPYKTGRGLMMWGFAAAGGFALFIAPYLVLNLRLTGGLLPDTAAAKQAQAAAVLGTTSLPQRIWQMIEPLTAGGQLLLLPGMVCFAIVQGRALRSDRRRWLDWLLLLWPVVLILLYAARLPAPYQHGRYVIPALPCLLVAGMTGLFWLMEQGRRSLVGRVLTRALAVSTALVFSYFALLAGPPTYARDVRIIDEEMVASALWIKEHIPPEDLLAIHDIGAVGYFAPRPILDIAGLVSPEMIPLIGDEEATWNWMQRKDARYLMAFPNQVPGGDTRDSRLCLVFTTDNPTAKAAGGSNMSIYALAWDGDCLN
ncbi:MAG: hypothetical protein K8J31_24675 [Anaerolineae bacterium]|nr:hypothetical protein [Anaerolineae bacterium]